MRLLVSILFGKYFTRHILCADIARLLQYFNNISDGLRNILTILQYFWGIYLQYFLNISGGYGLDFFSKDVFFF